MYTKDTQRLVVRIDKDLHRRSMNKAHAAGFSMSDVIRHALLAYTNSEETTLKFFMLDAIQAASAKQPVGRPKQKEEALFIPDLPDYLERDEVVMNNGSDVPS